MAYTFRKTGDNIQLSNGDISAEIPAANLAATSSGTDVVLTITDCKLSPSLVPIVMSEGTGTITIAATDITFPVGASAAVVAASLTLLKAFSFPLQGGAGGANYQKNSGSDYDFALV